jgi:hypothetical protein
MNYDISTLEQQNFLGFGGAGLVLQYHINKHSSIGMAATFRTNMTIPFLVIPMHNTTDFSYTGSMTASHYYALNKWEYGADLHHEQAQFLEENRDAPEIKSQYLRNIILCTAIKYRTSYSGYLGIEYIPTFVNIKGDGGNALNHSISLGLSRRLHLRNKK